MSQKKSGGYREGAEAHSQPRTQPSHLNAQIPIQNNSRLTSKSATSGGRSAMTFLAEDTGLGFTGLFSMVTGGACAHDSKRFSSAVTSWFSVCSSRMSSSYLRYGTGK